MVCACNESGLRVELPDGTAFFRLGECRAFDLVRHGRMHEMDVGWWDEPAQATFLVEIKDYSVRKPSREILGNLIAKGRDCLVMLHAAWCGSPKSCPCSAVDGQLMSDPGGDHCLGRADKVLDVSAGPATYWISADT